ncbi:hypothetical protein BN1221_00492 [Brenneria goodwinii]|uniref:Uncharacterized protein n=1 Tax=Brenneria goodwinii TaxID=1109412 RepID=A0A0G4JQ96_9GAMM|nr:hypothetical protein BN1221_00492 [Brenneria goodwinii]
MGALIPTFFNETKWKQHLNRGYDSESGTTILFLCLSMNSYIIEIQ